ncbi:MAG: hypothetical protein KGZ71_09230 [Desulfobulbaceae bacterium]|nr:hypothetical protein [Desulfobulbaceae bacterium]
MEKKDYLNELDKKAIKNDMNKIIMVVSLLVLIAATIMIYIYISFDDEKLVSETVLTDELQNKTKFMDSLRQGVQREALPEKYDEDEIRIVVNEEMLYERATRKKDEVSAVKYTIAYDVELQSVVDKVAFVLSKLSLPVQKSETESTVTFATNYHEAFNKTPKSVVRFKYEVEIEKSSPRNVKMLYYYQKSDEPPNNNLTDANDYFNKTFVVKIKEAF